GEWESFRAHTGRTRPPVEAARAAYLAIGRGGGKSLMASLRAVYQACFVHYPALAPGDRATIGVIAEGRAQARICMRFIRAVRHETPCLEGLIERETESSIDLT